MLDLIIVGAGPIGLTAGIEARKHNLNYLIIEKGVLVNSLYHYPDNMTFFSTSEKLEIGGVPFVSHNPKPTRPEALEYYRRVAEKYQLQINFYEHIHRVVREAEAFKIVSSGGEYRCRKLILSTGFYDVENRLKVPGEDLPKVKHYYQDPHPYFRQRLAVIGAQNSAVDAALECWRKGAEVSMLVRGSEIGSRVKYWVRPDILNRIEEGSIKAYFNAEITEITAKQLSFRQNGKEIKIPNDFVLALTGYQPDFRLLEQCGVQLQADLHYKPCYNEESMESNVEGIYLAGVIVGGLKTAEWFIENSRVHAEIAVKHIATKLGR